MYIKREKKQHMKGVGERKTYINNIEEKISTMYAYKWSRDLMYKNKVSKKKRYIASSLHPSKRNNTPPTQ